MGNDDDHKNSYFNVTNSIKGLVDFSSPVIDLGTNIRTAIDIMINNKIDGTLLKAEEYTNNLIGRQYRQMAVIFSINLLMALVAVVLDYFSVAPGLSFLMVALIYLGLVVRFLIAVILTVKRAIFTKKESDSFHYLSDFLTAYKSNGSIKNHWVAFKEACRVLFDKIYKEKSSRKIRFGHKALSTMGLSMSRIELFEVIYLKAGILFKQILLSKFVTFVVVFAFYLGLGYLFRVTLFDNFYRQNIWQVLIYPFQYLLNAFSTIK